MCEVLFPFHIERNVGFELYGDNVRRCVDEILKIPENPCLGQRLRQLPGAPETEWRWDHFCKFNLPRLLRLIYRWEPETNVVTFVALGVHKAGGLDVYSRLARAFELPPDHGHTEITPHQCCDT